MVITHFFILSTGEEPRKFAILKKKVLLPLMYFFLPLEEKAIFIVYIRRTIVIVYVSLNS